VNAHINASAFPSSQASSGFSSGGGDTSSLGPVFTARFFLALTCSLAPVQEPVFLVTFPLALSCSLAAFGPRVFGGLFIICRNDRSLSRLYISTHLLTLSLCSACLLDIVLAVASTTAVPFAADLVTMALAELSLLGAAFL
jgi:hypothetical protein